MMYSKNSMEQIKYFSYESTNPSCYSTGVDEYSISGPTPKDIWCGWKRFHHQCIVRSLEAVEVIREYLFKANIEM